MKINVIFFTSQEKYVDFQSFSSAALWYQQEVLSLVMKFYGEDQLMDVLVGDGNDWFSTTYVPSAIRDAEKVSNRYRNKKHGTI